ncbi:MAG: AAA family ATPase [Leptospiraceae bacterium]|nr:AAA family ATPase [Leptospiraceae bacterium]
MLNLPEYIIQSKFHESKKTVVYRGIKKSNNQNVILKILKKDFNAELASENLMIERDILKIFDHPYIIKFYEFHNFRDFSVMIMEDIGGDSLKNIIETKKLDLFSILDIGIKITLALEDIHKKNVIHKDINPSNIVYNFENSEVRVIDFGISTKLKKENPLFIDLTKLEGTLAYISPEQTGRTNRAIDYRSDYYSLGATLYELATGQLPFTTKDPIELVYSHLAKSLIPMAHYDNDIPEIFSAIVTKLMSKSPDERYATSVGIRSDLEECKRQLEESGHVKNFELGAADYSGKLNLSGKLYGRDLEVNLLVDTFYKIINPNPWRESRVSNLFLVTGNSGIGKSNLVKELHKPVIEKRAYFVSAKYEELAKNVPYSAILNGLREVIYQILSNKEKDLEAFKRYLEKSIESHLPILQELIPELSLLIPVQTELQYNETNELQSRILRAFHALIKAISKKEHPLVLFLDDLQWADFSSIRVIESLLLEDDVEYFFLIGAYRDSELTEVHPLSRMIFEISKRGFAPAKIALQPLQIHHIINLLADTFKTSLEDVSSVGAIVYSKTAGNPFYINEFIKTAYDKKLIYFDWNKSGLTNRKGAWNWDLDKIKEMDLTGNVADLLVDKIKSLPAISQHVLELAACISTEFDLKTLSNVFGRNFTETGALLWNSMQIELIYPINDEYKLLMNNDELSIDPSRIKYRFVHDKIQSAAYSLLNDNQKQETHLKIGRLLKETLSPEELHENIFEVTTHFNLGLNKVNNEEEKRIIAEMNLKSAQKAKDSAAFSIALNLVKIGTNLIGDKGWENNYQLMSELYFIMIEALFANGEIEESEKIIYQILDKLKSNLEKLELYRLLIVGSNMTARYSNAIEIGREAMLLVGIIIPEEEFGPLVQIENIEINNFLAKVQVKDLLDHKLMSNELDLAVIKILSVLKSTAYLFNTSLYPLIVTIMVNFSIKRGNAPESCFAYSTYGIIRSAFLGDFPTGFEFGNLALMLSKKFNNRIQICKTSYILASYLLFRRESLFESIELNESSFKLGYESGEFQFGGYGGIFKLLCKFQAGIKLREIDSEINSIRKFLLSSRNLWALDVLDSLYLCTSNLIGKSDSISSFENEKINELEFLKRAETNQSSSAICLFSYYKSYTLFTYENFDEALVEIEKAYKMISTILGQIEVFQIMFIYFICICQNYKKFNEDEIIEKNKLLDNLLVELKLWSESASMNFQHKVYIAEAMYLAIKKENWLASVLFEKAIQQSRENKFYHDLALAYEIAARFYFDSDMSTLGFYYIRGAYHRYSNWDAIRKVKLLEEKYPVLTLDSSIEAISFLETSTKTITVNARTGAVLDLLTMLKATQAISSEIQLESLTEKLMSIILEHAGAEKAVLMLQRDNKIYVEAVALPNGAIVPQSMLLEDVKIIPNSIINYVKRSKTNLIVEDPILDPRFKGDEYIRSAKPKSVICVILENQGKSIGYIYLESSLGNVVFTKERMEILKIITSQAAVSLENAMLYENLETKVVERTKELNNSLRIIKTDLETAKDIQEKLLPPKLSKLSYLDYFYRYLPMEEVGGDILDIYEVAYGHVRIFIADATGHGVKAALVTMAIKGEYENLKKFPMTPSMILEILNKEYCEKFISLSSYFSCFLMDINFYENKILYSSCGHPTQILLKDDSIIKMERTGNLIGIARSITVDLKELPLENSKILLFTDGLIDQINSEKNSYGEENLMKNLMANINFSLEKNSDKLIEDVKNFMGKTGLIDDLTLIGIEIDKSKFIK